MLIEITQDEMMLIIDALGSRTPRTMGFTKLETEIKSGARTHDDSHTDSLEETQTLPDGTTVRNEIAEDGNPLQTVINTAP